MTKAEAMLLKLKRADLQLATIRQCVSAVDHGIHIGGAYSALTPLTALFYGGYIRPNVAEPTDPGADIFILSKGHAVAAMASVYADLGYFDGSVLENSRAYESLLKGHPGPILPGVPVSTGPLGHGISISCGFATLRRESGADVFCMTGDGELQEGSNWEGILYAADKRLSNLCVLVDRNHGQSDCGNRLVVELGDLAAKFEAFGWKAKAVDGTSVEAVSQALDAFKDGPRDGRPTAIICDTRKGLGGHISESGKHKATLSQAAMEVEIEGIEREQRALEDALTGLYGADMADMASRLNYALQLDADGCISGIKRLTPVVKTRRAAPRDKRLHYDATQLPRFEAGKAYLFDDVIRRTMKVFARDARVCSIDSDLSNTSGLMEGVSAVDGNRALNAGIAESLMMCMAEAYAAEGYNAWCSTFAVFFDARAMRRIGVSYQERMECIRAGGWLSEGHNLDIAFVATAPNLETQVNGATHMGNDDACMYAQFAHMKIIDVCCPRQMVAVMRWIAEGNRGLVYVRVPRMPAAPVYAEDAAFAFGRATPIFKTANPQATVVSSGRGVHEALAAARTLEKAGIRVDVIDMPSVDENACRELAQKGAPVLFYEHNNGWLLQECLLALSRRGISSKCISGLNCQSVHGERWYIHSGAYAQLLEAMGLSQQHLMERLTCLIKGCID